jgi:hypothetical protein
MARPRRGAAALACAVLVMGIAGCEGDFYYSNSGFRCNEPALGYQYGSCEGGAEMAIVYGALIGFVLIGKLIDEIANGCR